MKRLYILILAIGLAAVLTVTAAATSYQISSFVFSPKAERVGDVWYDTYTLNATEKKNVVQYQYKLSSSGSYSSSTLGTFPGAITVNAPYEVKFVFSGDSNYALRMGSTPNGTSVRIESMVYIVTDNPNTFWYTVTATRLSSSISMVVNTDARYFDADYQYCNSAKSAQEKVAVTWTADGTSTRNCYYEISVKFYNFSGSQITAPGPVTVNLDYIRLYKVSADQSAGITDVIGSGTVTPDIDGYGDQRADFDDQLDDLDSQLDSLDASWEAILSQYGMTTAAKTNFSSAISTVALWTNQNVAAVNWWKGRFSEAFAWQPFGYLISLSCIVALFVLILGFTRSRWIVGKHSDENATDVHIVDNKTGEVVADRTIYSHRRR